MRSDEEAVVQSLKKVVGNGSMGRRSIYLTLIAAEPSLTSEEIEDRLRSTERADQ